MTSIAVAQTLPVRGDVDANLGAHLELIALAADARAEVLVFPELSLTGYEMDVAASLAFAEGDPRLSPLTAAAASRGMTIVAGAPLALHGALHIGAFIFRPDGEVDVYTKHHLGAFAESARCDGDVPPPEATVFAAGTHNPLIALSGGVAAVAVCADFGRAAHAAAAAAGGAHAYLASAFVIPSEYERDAARLRGYATTHAMAVALANFGGPSGGLAAAGRSAIWSERGELLLQLPARGAGVGVAAKSRSGWTATTITA